MKDVTTGTRIDKPGPPGIWIELTGEFDVCDLEPLRRTLDGALGSGPPIYVDLSSVTFLDLLCTRELAVRSRSHDGRLTLRDPSWQVESSFSACGFGDPEGGGEDAARNPGVYSMSSMTESSAKEEYGG